MRTTEALRTGARALTPWAGMESDSLFHLKQPVDLLISTIRQMKLKENGSGPGFIVQIPYSLFSHYSEYLLYMHFHRKR